MSVKLLDNQAFYGYRVRRTVQGEIYQEYFSLKANGKRLSATATKQVKAEADRRDRELAALQRRAKVDQKPEKCFRPDNTIKGVSYLVKREKNGAGTPIFQIGIASEKEQRIICTSVSINAYGAEGAWTRAIKLYSKHKNISRSAPLYSKLLGAIQYYGLPE